MRRQARVERGAPAPRAHLPSEINFCCLTSPPQARQPPGQCRTEALDGREGGAGKRQANTVTLAFSRAGEPFETQRSDPERPGSGGQHEGGDQGIGRGVGQHRVAQAAPVPKGQGVEHPRDGAGHPALVHRTEEK